MLRSVVKTGICKVLHATGLSRIRPLIDGSDGHPVVLGYHRVVSDFTTCAKSTIPGMLVSSRTFEQQLDWLARQFEILPLDSVAPIGIRAKHKRRAVAITFDDGYRDNFE